MSKPIILILPHVVHLSFSESVLQKVHSVFQRSAFQWFLLQFPAYSGSCSRLFPLLPVTAVSRFPHQFLANVRNMTSIRLKSRPSRFIKFNY